MSLRFVLALSFAGMAAAAFPASAQMTQMSPVCSAPAELPPLLKTWRSPLPATAAADAKQAVGLISGQAMTLALRPTPQVRFPAPPAKPGGPASFGGLAGFTVKQPGRWRVALSSAAWVDVVKDGKAAMSVAHGHGPDCTGVRKMVDYQLTPGTYTLQVAANAQSSITLLVAPLP